MEMTEKEKIKFLVETKNIKTWTRKKKAEHLGMTQGQLSAFMHKYGITRDLYKKKKENNMEETQKHYAVLPVQVIELIKFYRLGFCEGNILKYIARYPHKNGEEDIEKAIWYTKAIAKGTERVSRNNIVVADNCKYLNWWLDKNKLALNEGQKRVIKLVLNGANSNATYNDIQKQIRACVVSMSE